MAKTTLVIFYTEGAPFDQGKDLSSSAHKIKEQCQGLFDYVVLLSPSLLRRKDKRWENILYDHEQAARHIESKQRPGSINIPWANLNCLLWKPAIMSAMLSEDSEIEEDSIIIYHDIDYQKYPMYKKNFAEVGPFVKNTIKNHSILLITDALINLYIDCKQEVLRKYLNSEGRTLCHRWAGCLAMKKNSHSREFCLDWFNLTSKHEVRSQITSFDNYQDFFWHSPEQATLSVVYYLWKYRFMKGRHVKTLFTREWRAVTEKWSIRDRLKFARRSINFHSNKYFLTSLQERLLIMNCNISYLDWSIRLDNALPGIENLYCDNLRGAQGLGPGLKEKV
jgi:hypothetical protein